MVREIVHIQVGQCGNNIGNAFWDTLCHEHNLDYNGKVNGIQQDILYDNINVYFNETPEQRYVPRACVIDTDPGYIEYVSASQLSNLFKPDNIYSGESSCGNNFCKGHYSYGWEICDEIMDIIRKEVEDCDHVHSFQLTHSLGGGCGSGLGTLILCKTRDEYIDKLLATFSVLPSPKVSDVVVEPYNAVLAMLQLTEGSDLSFVIDNQALFYIAQNILKLHAPKYMDLNWVISMVMSGITSSLRFGGELNSDLRKLAVNLVPFPRLHFLTCSQAPLFMKGNGKYFKLNVKELSEQLWSKNNSLSDINWPQVGKSLSSAFIYRSHGINATVFMDGYIRNIMGTEFEKTLPLDVIELFHEYSTGYKGNGIETELVESVVSDIQLKNEEKFVQWIPENVKTCIVGVGSHGTSVSGTLIGNTTAIKEVFERISIQFGKIFKTRAFVHWYKGEGMGGKQEFENADQNLRDLIVEYQDKCDAVVDSDQVSGQDSDKFEDDLD